MNLRKFSDWVLKTYGNPAPAELLAFLKDSPDGIQLVDGLRIYSIEDIKIYTEEWELEENGVLYIGAGHLTVILLRVKDGKVFMVDSMDYKIVDATFKSLERFVQLLDHA